MAVEIPCDVQQRDASGFVFAFLDEARNPEIIRPGAIVVAGDAEEPVFARVVCITGQEGERLVHLDIAPGAPRAYLVAAARAHLVAAYPTGPDGQAGP